MVKLHGAKKGFVLLPRRWAVECSFGWLAPFRHLLREFAHMPHVLAALHVLVFAVLMLLKAVMFPAAGERA